MSSRDESDLLLLARLHYVLAALTAASGLVLTPLVWSLLNWFNAVMKSAEEPRTGVSTAELDRLANLSALSFAAAVSLVVLCLAHAGVLVYIGRCVVARRRRWLILIFSILHLIAVPLGTALSIFTFVILTRPSIKELFRSTRATSIHGSSV